MKQYVNCRKPNVEDDNLYRAAVARYYLSEATKKPKKSNLDELAHRWSYIPEAARVVKDLVDDETYYFMMGLNRVASFETAIDMLKDAMDFRSPMFYPDFRVLSSAANAFNKYEGTPWVDTLRDVNKKREQLGLFTYSI
jgi:exonuclease III